MTNAKQKCQQLLAHKDYLTEGRRRFVESVAKQIELNEELYPSPHQNQILRNLYRQFVRDTESQAEKDARDFLGM